MKKDISIDFNHIDTSDHFFDQLKRSLPLPDYFGYNIDALYDLISGDLKMPLQIRFVNMSPKQLKTFDHLISTMEDARLAVEGFTFSYTLR